MSISTLQKKSAIKQVLNQKISISQVAKDHNVARKTIYSWLNRYKKAPPRLKAQALDPAYLIGNKHPRSVAGKARLALIRLIVSHPEWGSRKYSFQLKNKGYNLGYFGVYKLLDDLQANSLERRLDFRKNWSGPRRLKSGNKFEIVKGVIGGQKNVTQVARESGVARKTIYEWIKRYKSRTVQSETVFKEAYVKAENHPKALYPGIQNQVLDLVANRPELSVHELATIVPASSTTI